MFVGLPDSSRRINRGSAFIALLDGNFNPVSRPVSIGSVSCDMDIKAEYLDFRDNQTQNRDRSFGIEVQRDIDLKFSYEQYVGVLLQQLYQATTSNFTQAAVANGSQSFPTALPNGVTAANASAQQILDSLPVTNGSVLQLHDASGQSVFNVTGVAVTDGTTPLPAGTYVVEPITGKIQIVVAPVSGIVDVTFTAPAITAAQGLTIYNILQQQDAYAMVIIRQNNKLGQNFDHVFTKVHMRTPSSVKLIGGDNTAQKTDVTCPVFSDSRYPGREMGFAVTAIPTA